jgi:signal peptide peptidase SppA
MKKKKTKLNFRAPWAVTRTEFERLFNYKSELEFLTIEEKPNSDFENIGETAIIRIHDVIMRYNDFWSFLFGATTIETLQDQFNAAMEDKKIKSILFDINSPGGQSDGVAEFAENIFQARNKKNIISYISNLGASGAYWIAAASNKIVSHETAFSGSIGVIASYSSNDEGEVIDIVSNVSPMKNPDIATEEGRGQIQKHIDSLAAIFVRKIATYRKTGIDNVRNNFGRGDIVIGKDALARGMVDKIGNFKTALNLAKNKLTEDKMDIQFDIKSEKENVIISVLNEDKKINSIVIDEKFLTENANDLILKIKDSGIQSERIRLNAIDKIKFDSKNKESIKLVNEARETGMSAEKLAFNLNQLEDTLILDMRNKRKIDSNELPAISEQENSTDSETMAIREAMKAQAKQILEVK